MEYDIEKLMKVDSASYIKDLEDFPYYIMDGYELPAKIEIESKEIDNIIVCGMGGSGIPGDILKVYMNKVSKIPVFVNKGYNLPDFADKKTMVICISYSGNTEETVDAFRDALRRSCHTVVISSGGKMKDLANNHKKPFVQIPQKHQPRAMVPYLFFSMLRVLVEGNIIKDVKSEVESLSKFLKNNLFRDKGLHFAENLVGKVPLIYASDDFYPVAMRFKTQINENVKIHAFFNTFSEMNHNEIVGYTDLYTDYHAVIFESESDHPRIKKRYEICKQLIKKKGVPVTQMKFTGKSYLKQLFTAIFIGDWTSYYLALFNKVDPSPVDIIENLKKQLKR
jgi:glucose/mannose-6-phosphate isomerase